MGSLTLDARVTLFRRAAARLGAAVPTEAPERAEETESGRGEMIKTLVLRARDGDAEAFGGLYDHYVELVYRYVFYRVGTHSLAEDLTSETFLRALRRIRDFSWQGKDFGAWLVTIARNLVADHFKSSRYRLEVCTAELLEPDRPQESPERAVLESMTNRTLLVAVRRLGSEQQECVVLRFLHGLTVAETALVMGKKSGAIKALQYRAVRSLARMLPDDLRS
jgi:RNA polymerase sigma-70 factor (ECF subfamily)